MLVRLGAFYLDSVLDSGATARPGVINRNPEPSETGAREDGEIRLTIIDTGAAGLNPLTTTVTVDDGTGPIVAWNGTAFHASYLAGSSFVAARSDGAGPDDEHRVILKRATDFASEATLTVTLHAVTLDAFDLDTSYSFQIRDYAVPIVQGIVSLGLRKIALAFDEPVVMGTDVPGDALRVRLLSSAELVAPADLLIPVDAFTSDDVGLYVSIAGAESSANNAPRRVASVSSAKRVTLDSAVVSEKLPSAAVATIGPYGLEGVEDASHVIPVFTPTIIAAEQGQAGNIVVLTLHAELSPGREYKFSVHQVDDTFGNRLLNLDPLFTAETLYVPTGRWFEIVESVPSHNIREDTSRDLERTLRCIDEAAKLLLNDVDRFGELLDVDKSPDAVLDALLAHLGNPFTFVASLSDAQKRKLVDVLVEIYKRNATESGIEAVVNFFTGIAVDIVPYTGIDAWILDESLLGEDTYLAPSEQFLLYSFEAVSPVTLTDAQRSIIEEVVEYMKPSHTHFIRFVEP